MNTKNLQIAIVAVSLSVAFVAAPAFAQNGPGGQNYGAGSSPQSGGTNYQAPSSQVGRGLYNTQQPQQNVGSAGSAGPAGPAGANYGAGTGPQTGR
jgi:hypothetical protein